MAVRAGWDGLLNGGEVYGVAHATPAPGDRVDVHTSHARGLAVVRSEDPGSELHSDRAGICVQTQQCVCCAGSDVLKAWLRGSASPAGQLVLEHKVFQHGERNHLLQDGVLALERAGIGNGIPGSMGLGHASAHVEGIPINRRRRHCGACFGTGGQNLLYPGSTLVHG